MPLPAAGSLTRNQVAHLLRRATFGATKQQINTLTGQTATSIVNTVLFGQALTPPQDLELPIDPKTGTEWFSGPVSGANSRGDELQDFFFGWLFNQMMSPDLAHAAREKVTWFLHTHFTTRREVVNNSHSLFFQSQLLRTFALDKLAGPDVNFKALTVKISVDNAMLVLLDGDLNVAGSVNENYARELLELYSIGRGLEYYPPTTSGAAGDYGVYTEADVQMAARVLSGWGFDDTFGIIDEDTELPRGRLKNGAHDVDTNKPKTFSNRLSGATVTPDATLTTPEERALDEISQLVDIIYDQPETARNICRKVYRFYLWAPHTKDETDVMEAVIDQMVITFKNNNFKLQPVIEELLASQHFYDAAAPYGEDAHLGSLIKSPVDIVIGTLKFFEIQLPGMTSQVTQFYDATNQILSWIKSMAMDFYSPYDVAGYEAYHQFPVFHRFWITPNTLTRRYNFINEIINQETMNATFKAFDILTFVQNRFNAEAAGGSETFIKALVSYLLPVTDNLSFDDAADDASTLTAQRLGYFKQKIVNATYAEGYYWGPTPSLEDKRGFMRLLFNALLQTPEYQLA